MGKLSWSLEYVMWIGELFFWDSARIREGIDDGYVRIST